MQMTKKRSAFTATCDRIFLSLPVLILEFLVGSLVIWKEYEVKGAVFFVAAICVFLVLCENVLTTTMPFLLLCVFVCSQYNSFSSFIVYWWMVIPVVLALLYHFIRFHKPFRIGVSFWGILAVAFSVTLGGLGSIEAKDYFQPMALYYVAGLGFGMVIAYLLMKSQLDVHASRKQTEKFLTILYLLGFFCGVFIAKRYALQWDTVVAGRTLAEFQASNNISTFLMFALPIPFYRANKNPLHLLAGLLFFGLLILTGSRGGALMGALEFVLCSIYLCWHSEKAARGIYMVFFLCAFLACGLVLKDFFQFTKVYDSSRLRLIRRAADAFQRYPLFGHGLASPEISDIYSPVKGGLYWYHMSIPQIVGSLGSVGIFAYASQAVGRLSLIFRKTNCLKLALGLSYAGLALMSLVNPGEFCPLPYELLAVMIFIFLEQEQNEVSAV